MEINSSLINKLNKHCKASKIFVIGLLTLLTTCLFLSGCSKNNKLYPDIPDCGWDEVESTEQSSESERVALTERQKQILIHEGVTEEEISAGTFNATSAIHAEKMLRYLENKYPSEKFEFFDYQGAEYMAFEKVADSKTIALCRYGRVTVECKDKNEYTDDFQNTKYEYLYAEKLKNHITETFIRNNNRFDLKVEAWGFSDEKIGGEEDDLFSRCNVSCYLFVGTGDESKYKESKTLYSQVAEDLAKYVDKTAKDKIFIIRAFLIEDKCFTEDTLQEYIDSGSHKDIIKENVVFSRHENGVKKEGNEY